MPRLAEAEDAFLGTAALLVTAPPADGGLFGAAPPPETLDIPEDDPVARRIRALAEPRLFLLRRGWDDEKKRLKIDVLPGTEPMPVELAGTELAWLKVTGDVPEGARVLLALADRTYPVGARPSRAAVAASTSRNPRACATGSSTAVRTGDLAAAL